MTTPSTALRQRGRVLVRYEADATLWHERVLLHPVQGIQWMVVSPDRDVFPMTVNSPPLLGVALYRGGQLPPGVDPDLVYGFADAPSGALSEAELDGILRDAEAGAVAARAALAPDRGDGSWRALRAAAGYSAGDVVTVDGGLMESGIDGLMPAGDGKGAVHVRWVPSAEREEFVRSLDDSDVRVLPVVYDRGSGERCRTVDELVPALTMTGFGDWPLDGERSLLWFAQQLRRRSCNFVTHHEQWVSKSGIREGDRSAFEHQVLCKALQLLGEYDQVNLPNLCGAEYLLRRVMLIENAYSGRASAPSYEGAEHFLGTRDSADGSLVDPAARRYVASKLKIEAETRKETRLWREEQSKGKGKGDKGDKAGGGAVA